jgi:hypothetical protein
MVTAEAATSTAGPGGSERRTKAHAALRSPRHLIHPPSSPPSSPGPARSQIKGTPRARAGTRHGAASPRPPVVLVCTRTRHPRAPASLSAPVASARAPPALAPWRRLPLRRRRRRWHGTTSSSGPAPRPRPPRRRPAASSAAWVGRPGTGRPGGRGGGGGAAPASGRRARGWTWTWPAAPSR